MRYTPDGTPVTTLSVATNRKWTNQDGTPGEETTWFRVTAWRKTAEAAAKYLKKGRQVLIEGRLKPDPQTGGPKIWQRRDGTSGASYEVTASTVRFLGHGETTAAAPNGAPPVEEAGGAPSMPY
ncbi:MAG: single-stranded DNA-binding protein [Anaerolineae bacterium]|nr:single-stranded DNA-binding protein [Anaerolineae bacterium]